jgi:polysaccharide biosynthesis/export protein
MMVETMGAGASEARRWTWRAAGRVIAVMAVAMIAVCTRVGATEHSAATEVATEASEDYRLAPGDRVSMLVFDEPQLSGKFVVDGSGELLLPLAGAIDVAGLTLAEAQARIQKRLADGILVSPSVSLHVVAYRPFFIFGNVKKPGSYTFQFGQSVRAAIARAGGQGRLSSAAMSDYVMAEERVRLLENRSLGLTVRKLRLVAEQNEAPNFNMPQLVGYSASSEKIGLFYAAENDVFESEMSSLRSRLDLLAKQRPRFEAEKKAVSEQLANERRRTTYVKSRVDELDDYRAKGLVRTSVLNEQQREEARAMAEVARLEAELADLDRQMGDLDIRIDDAKATFKGEVMKDLHETIQNLREVQVTLQTSRELLEYRAEDAGVAEGGEDNTTIMISRADDHGATDTFKADYDTLLQPGDVVEVKRKTDEPVSRSGVASEALLLPTPIKAGRAVE